MQMGNEYQSKAVAVFFGFENNNRDCTTIWASYGLKASKKETTFHLHCMHKRRSINKLQNGIILLIFKI